MRICKFSAFILLVIALLSPGISASGFENSQIGIKAGGMSGAFRAIADDWTAAYYNPAGYAYIYDNQLGGNLALVHYRNELTPNYEWPGSSGWTQPGVFNGSTIYNFHEILSNPSGGFVVRMPVWGETVFGFSVYQPYDYNVTWKLYENIDAYNNLITMPGDQYRNNLDVVAFQLTAGREFMEEKLALGLGLQVLRIDLLYNDIIFRDNPFWDNLPTQYQTMFTSKITEWSNNDGYGFGFGLRAGALWKVNEKVNLALTASLPFDVTVSGNSSLEFYMPNVPLLSSDSLPIANPGQPANLFLTGAKVIDSADFDVEVDLPPAIGVGMAYTVNDKFRIGIDAEYTFWSGYDGLFFEFSGHQGIPTSADSSEIAKTFLTSNISSPVDWKDAFKFMFGAKYDLSGVMTLVGGTSFDQSPCRDSDQLTPQFVDTGDKFGLTGGLIFHIQQWDLGLATSYVRYPDLTVDKLVDLDGDGNMDSFGGVYKADTYETTLSFNYRF